MSATHPASLTVQVALPIRRRPGRKTVVTPEELASPDVSRPAAQTHGEPAAVKALARAFRYQRPLNEGQHASITEMAEADRLDRGYMGRLLQLTLLAPKIVERVLDVEHSEQFALLGLLSSLPVNWGQQGSAHQGTV
jgi:hypothetical protein